MAYTEAHKRAQKKYVRDKTTQISLRFYNATESDLLEWMQAQENKQGYLKSLIRADMEKHGLTSKNIEITS